MSGHVIVARSLESEVRFDCPDADVARAISFVAAEPDMGSVNLDVIDVQVVRLDHGFYDFSPPRSGAPGTARHAVERANTVLRDQLVKELAGTPLVHAASLIIEGRRCLILAEKGSGKTTLMLEALRQGITVEGDEHVAVYEDSVLARPRTLRIKANSLSLAGHLRERILAAPSILDWNGSPIYSLVPNTTATDWHIARGPAHAIVHLQPNHHALTSTTRMQWDESFTRLLDGVLLPQTGRARALGNLQRMAMTKPGWSMRIGDLDRAIWHLRQICVRL